MEIARSFAAIVAAATQSPGATREPGQAMAEYGLILAGVAAIVIVVMDRLDYALAALLNRVASSLT